MNPVHASLDPSHRGLGRTVVWFASVLAIMALLLAGCGDDDDSGSSPTSSSEGRNGDEGGGEESTPTGEPIKILTAGPYTNPAGATVAGAGAGVEAHAAVLNAEGGIGGRPIQVIVCDTQLDPVRELDCVREAIAEDVAAVVGFGPTTDAADELALLEEAGIPSIGTVVVDRASVQSAISFPTSGGAIGQVIAAPAVLEAAGTTAAGLMIPDVSGAAVAQLERIWDLGVANAGVENKSFFPIPLDSTDLSPTVAAAVSSGVDGVGVNLPGDLLLRLLQAIQQQAGSLPVVIVGGAPEAELLESAGDVVEGLKVLTSYPAPSATEVPGIDRLVREISDFDESAAINDDVINAWLATYIFGIVADEVATSGDAVNASSILEALNGQNNIDTLGLTPPLDFTTPFTGIPGSERFFNPAVVAMTVKDGEIVLDDTAAPFINGFA